MALTKTLTLLERERRRVARRDREPIPNDIFPVENNGHTVAFNSTEGTAAAAQAAADDKRIYDIPVDAIIPDPHQPRRHFETAALEELAASMKEQGVLQPITVSPIPVWDGSRPQKHTLVTGERRWRAAQIAGLPTIPAIVRDTGNRSRVHQLIENLQRQDLNDVEVAYAILELHNEGLSQRDIQKALGFSSLSQVTQRFSLAKCPPDIIDLVREHPGTMSHALLVDKVKEPKLRARLIEEVKAGAAYPEIKEQVNRVLPRYSDSGNDNGSPDASAMRYDSPQRGIKQLPGVSIVAHLKTAADSLERAAEAYQGVKVPRSAIAGELKRIEAAAAVFEK